MFNTKMLITKDLKIWKTYCDEAILIYVENYRAIGGLWLVQDIRAYVFFSTTLQKRRLYNALDQLVVLIYQINSNSHIYGRFRYYVNISLLHASGTYFGRLQPLGVKFKRFFVLKLLSIPLGTSLRLTNRILYKTHSFA